MINTPAFASLERYKRLDEALAYLNKEHGLNPYNWMKDAILAAMDREKRFMDFAAAQWLKELYPEKTP